MRDETREFWRLHEISQHPSRFGEFADGPLAGMQLYICPDDDPRAGAARRLALMALGDWLRRSRKRYSYFELDLHLPILTGGVQR